MRVAPVAKQQGRHVGKLIKARLRGAAGIGPFHYSHRFRLGSPARLVRLADLDRRPHLFFIGFRNRMIVALTGFGYISCFSAARAWSPIVPLNSFDPLVAPAGEDAKS